VVAFVARGWVVVVVRYTRVDLLFVKCCFVGRYDDLLGTQSSFARSLQCSVLLPSMISRHDRSVHDAMSRATNFDARSS